MQPASEEVYSVGNQSPPSQSLRPLSQHRSKAPPDTRPTWQNQWLLNKTKPNMSASDVQVSFSNIYHQIPMILPLLKSSTFINDFIRHGLLSMLVEEIIWPALLLLSFSQEAVPAQSQPRRRQSLENVFLLHCVIGAKLSKQTICPIVFGRFAE